MEDVVNLEVDDLFNESDLNNPALEIPLATGHGATPQPLSSSARQHLDDLHLYGCNQKLAWSKTGCIASVSPDATTIYVQYLHFVSSSGIWELTVRRALQTASKDSPHAQSNLTFDHKICYIAWGMSGTEIAILDVLGRVRICAMAPALMNRFIEEKLMDLDQPDELHRAVGLFWLPATDRATQAVTNSSKIGDHWAPAFAKRLPVGPFWPRALLVVMSNGVLRLLYAGPDHRYSEEQISVYPITALHDRLTHAAFGSIKANANNSILVASYAANGKLSTFIVEVSMPDLRQDPLLTVRPQMKIHHIKYDVSALPLATEDDAQNYLHQKPFADEQRARLSHLEIVTPSDIEKSVQVPTTIFAVFTNYSYLSGMQSAWSTIKRWKVSCVDVKLHSQFEEIVSTRNSAELIRHHLEKMPDVQLEQAIASFNLVDHGQTIVATTLDGTISFYNPETMQQLFFESEANEVTSMSQAQFAFPPTPTPFQLAFSPSACAAVCRAPDGTLQLSTMEHHAGIQTDSANKNLDAALAALVLTYVRAFYSNFNADDVLVCILRTINPQHYRKLISSMSHSLFRDADFLGIGVPGSDTEKLLQKPMVGKLQSLQSVLGFTSAATDSSSLVDGPRRNSAARYAWVMLNIRHTALLLFHFLNHQKSNISPCPPELLSIVSSNARWSVDLFRLIVNELFELSDAAGKPDVDSTNVHSPDTVLVQSLLTGIWSRLFLRTLIRLLRMALTNPTGAADPTGVVSRTIGRAERTGLSLTTFSHIIEVCDRFVGANDPQAERELLLTGEVVEGGKDVIGWLIREVLPVLRGRGEIDRLWLYTGDFRGVLLEQSSGGKRLDICTKVVLGSGGKDFRACARCGSLTEDFGGVRREWTKQLYQIISRCPCEGAYIESDR